MLHGANGGTSSDEGSVLALFVTLGSCACAIPIHHVSETMRPLPIESIAGMPEFVRGISLIRGAPVPVVDLQALLGDAAHDVSCQRFVTVKAGERTVALAVEGVLGVRGMDATALDELPSLLRESEPGVIDAIGRTDEQLLLVLRTARIVPEQVWTTLDLGTKV